MSEQRKVNKVIAEKVKVGDLMAFTYYAKIKQSLHDGAQVLITDVDNGKEIVVRGADLVEAALSADQFLEEVKVTKTQAAELLVSSYNRPFTVSFNKVDGEERILRGRLIRPEPLLGRSMVEDLDKSGKDRVRQVDHRTLNWIVVEGVKYVIK